MIQAKAVQSQAEAHRRDLMNSAGSRRTARGDVVAGDVRAAHRSATGRRVPGGRTVAPRLGAWLIEFGTKLGGAKIRTS
jgi:hypothetical protein